MIRWAEGWTTVHTRDHAGQLQPTRVGIVLNNAGQAIGMGFQIGFGPVAITTDVGVEDLVTAIKEQRAELVRRQWGINKP
jgi:hypothetical protein